MKLQDDIVELRKEVEEKVRQLETMKDDYETNYRVFGHLNKINLSRFFDGRYLTTRGYERIFTHKHFLEIFLLGPETEMVRSFPKLRIKRKLRVAYSIRQLLSVIFAHFYPRLISSYTSIRGTKFKTPMVN